MKEIESKKTKESPKRKRFGWLTRQLQFVVSSDAESEDPDENMRDLLRHIDGAWVRRQMRWVALVFVFAMLSITNGYITQTLQMKRNALKNEVEDYAFRSLTRSSQLTRETRQSLIEERLKANGDSTLTPTPDAPFLIERDGKQDEGE